MGVSCQHVHVPTCNTEAVLPRCTSQTTRSHTLQPAVLVYAWTLSHSLSKAPVKHKALHPGKPSLGNIHSVDTHSTAHHFLEQSMLSPVPLQPQRGLDLRFDSLFQCFSSGHAALERVQKQADQAMGVEYHQPPHPWQPSIHPLHSSYNTPGLSRAHTAGSRQLSCCHVSQTPLMASNQMTSYTSHPVQSSQMQTLHS